MKKDIKKAFIKKLSKTVTYHQGTVPDPLTGEPVPYQTPVDFVKMRAEIHEVKEVLLAILLDKEKG